MCYLNLVLNFLQSQIIYIFHYYISLLFIIETLFYQHYLFIRMIMYSIQDNYFFFFLKIM